MKFLLLALEDDERSFLPFIVNISQLSLVFEDELGDDWCLKLVHQDGSEFYCTHILNDRGNFVKISSMASFYECLRG